MAMSERSRRIFPGSENPDLVAGFPEGFLELLVHGGRRLKKTLELGLLFDMSLKETNALVQTFDIRIGRTVRPGFSGSHEWLRVPSFVFRFS